MVVAERQSGYEQVTPWPAAANGTFAAATPAHNPARQLQRILAERLLTEPEWMDFMLPQQSLVAVQIDSLASQASRFAGPTLLALVSLSVFRLFF